MKTISVILTSSALISLTMGCAQGPHSLSSTAQTVAPPVAGQAQYTRVEEAAPAELTTVTSTQDQPTVQATTAAAAAKPLVLPAKDNSKTVDINKLPPGKIETVLSTGTTANAPAIPVNSAANLNLPVETVTVAATAQPTQPNNLWQKKVNSGGTLRSLYDVLAESKVSQKALAAAIDYMSKTSQKFSNRHYMTLIDYSKPSTEKRMYVMNLDDGTYSMHLVAHGRGSGGLFATVFGNNNGSYMTSLGVFRTLETYNGAHGRSLRLQGLSTSNSQAYNREIVVHGAGLVDAEGQRVPYVSALFAKIEGYLGRSEGCPALDPAEAQDVIGKISSGSMMYAFKN